MSGEAALPELCKLTVLLRSTEFTMATDEEA